MPAHGDRRVDVATGSMSGSVAARTSTVRCSAPAFHWSPGGRGVTTGEMIHLGACHCEAIGFAYETNIAPEAWPLRACGCRFCRVHGSMTTSDPEGSLELRCRDAAQLARYQFGLRTAEFWLCRGCGVYLGAATNEGGFGIINTNSLIDRHVLVAQPQAMSYDGETASTRVARRQQRWTPIRPIRSPSV